MSAARFFTDEDLYGAASEALRRVGIDAVSTPEAGRQSQSDESQLIWSTSESRTLITFNVAHFVKLHASWLQSGKHHAGIIVSSQRPLGDLLRRLIHLAKKLDDAMLQDRLEFLSDW